MESIPHNNSSKSWSLKAKVSSTVELVVITIMGQLKMLSKMYRERQDTWWSMLLWGGQIKVKKTYGHWIWTMQFTSTIIFQERKQDSVQRSYGPDQVLATQCLLMHVFGAVLLTSLTHDFKMERRLKNGNQDLVMVNLLATLLYMLALWA